MKMRLMTWNVNGLRAVLQRLDQSLKQFLDGLDADIVCLQETKLTRSELDQELVRPPGYDAFYSFCRQRGGYSGVVTFCKSEMPTVAAEEGLTGLWRTEDSVGHVGSIHRELNSKLVNNLESEGRCVITDHQAFVLINTYCPALASQDRLEYKLQFHALLEDRVRALQEANKRVIVVGDINIAHREIDHCDPGAYRIEGVSFSDHPCRRWMDSFVGTPDEKGGASSPQSQAVKESENNISNQPILIDTFRYFHPAQTKAFTCWNTLTSARLTNYGTRLDYILVDPALLDCVNSCSIEPERQGSDHCPVVISCAVQFGTDAKCNTSITAALCAKNFIEFSGTQQSIKTFFEQKQDAIKEVHANVVSVSSPVMPSRRSMTSPSRPRKRISRGQQSITSFFNPPEGKRKLSSTLKEPKKVSSLHQDVMGGVGGDDSAFADFLTKKCKTAEEGRQQWQQVLSGKPPPAPFCHCGQPTVLRSVVKVNENWGRKFYVCTKPTGEKGNPDARCDFFQWADKNRKKATNNTQ